MLWYHIDMKTYFPGLNTLRLFAALSVVISHIPAYTMGYTFTVRLDSVLAFFTLTGYESVSLFFVLSGFLITYILLKEKQTTGSIAVKSFYIRRALRIQPLYVFVLILTLLIPSVPNPDGSGLVSIVLMSPHLFSIIGGSLGGLAIIWSIGVEEWFYIALPLLIKRINVPILACSAILMRIILVMILPKLMLGDPYVPGWLGLWHMLRIESMAIGALGAWIIINKHWVLRWLYRFEVLAWFLFAIIILLDLPAGFASNFAFSWVYLLIILNVATNPQRRISIEHASLSKLGTVTYGIYMFHPMVCYMAGALFAEIGLHGVKVDIVLYMIIVVVTICVALASYRWFESQFLKKQRPIMLKSIIEHFAQPAP